VNDVNREGINCTENKLNFAERIQPRSSPFLAYVPLQLQAQEATDHDHHRANCPQDVVDHDESVMVLAVFEMFVN
jgi:hypothetical protein